MVDPPPRYFPCFFAFSCRTFAIKFDRFRFSASAMASILPSRFTGRLIEICVSPGSRGDFVFLDFLAIVEVV